MTASPTPTPTFTATPSPTPTLDLTPTPTATPWGFSCAAVTGISQAECQTLVALYQALDGPNWPNQGGWLRSTTPCSWSGIGCSNGRTVYRLDLSGRGLRGPIPDAIGQLKELRLLYLSGNALTGRINPALAAIPYLQILDLSNNQLEGPLPPELGSLHLLQVLNLSNNRLSGFLIIDLSNPIWISTLDLSQNQFTGGIPAVYAHAFYAGSYTDRLDFSYNRLTGPVSAAFCRHPVLAALGLSYNALDESPLCLDAISPGWQDTQTIAPPVSAPSRMSLAAFA